MMIMSNSTKKTGKDISGNWVDSYILEIICAFFIMFDVGPGDDWGVFPPE